MTLRCSHIGPAVWKMNGWMIQLWCHLLVRWLYTHYYGALWDCMSAFDNVHYGFGHHYK